MDRQCKECKYYGEYICMVPLYVDGEYHRGRLVSPEEACELFEQKEDGNDG